MRLAAEELHPDWPVLVAACDNTHLYDEARLAAELADPSIACLVWTYCGEPRVLAKPHQFGWVRARTETVSIEVSFKTPISDDLLHDHVISGCFTFRSASLMIQAIDRMIARGLRVNGEYYLDVVPNLLIELGERVKVFLVDKYVGWGFGDPRLPTMGGLLCEIAAKWSSEAKPSSRFATSS